MGLLSSYLLFFGNIFDLSYNAKGVMYNVEKVERRHSVRDTEILLVRRRVDLPTHGITQSLLQVAKIVP